MLSDVDPVVVVDLGRSGLQILASAPHGGDLVRCPVTEPGVGPVVVVVDVRADLGAGLLDGSARHARRSGFLNWPSQDSMNACDSGSR